MRVSMFLMRGTVLATISFHSGLCQVSIRQSFRSAKSEYTLKNWSILHQHNVIQVPKIELLPHVVDGVNLAQLGEESGIGDIIPHSSSAFDSLGPIVTPIIHTSYANHILGQNIIGWIMYPKLHLTRLQFVAPNIINVLAGSLLGLRPVAKTFMKFDVLLFEKFQAISILLLILGIIFHGQTRGIHVVPALKSMAIISYPNHQLPSLPSCS